LLSDRKDLAFITVSALDADSVPVENARDRVKITVTGGGYLAGTDNGDSTDPDEYKSDCRRLFGGKLLLIVASNGLFEPVRINVKSSCAKQADMIIPVHASEPVQGISCLQRISGHEFTDHVDARKLEIIPVDPISLCPDQPSCSFRYQIRPTEAFERPVTWQVTNIAGIESPYVQVEEKNHIVTVTASGDGQYFMRGLLTESDQTILISQTEFSADGFGNPALNPYDYISAGLYDIHNGEIGTGNEKGIAFSRDGESMIGFSVIDFGKTGTDVITADIFALNDDPYDMEMWAGDPGGEIRLVTVLHYEKKSIWNVYQPGTWHLPERLSGIKTVCFKMRDKVHMRGFVFEKQSYAYILHHAADAEKIYGDNYRKEGKTVREIGNNVTLEWTDMDFGQKKEMKLEISGSTQLPVNTIQIRIRNEQGESIASVVEFIGKGNETQTFFVHVLPGRCSVSFLFLPGCAFDFRSFCFYLPESWTEK
jgi:beta-galactosidase